MLGIWGKTAKKFFFLDLSFCMITMTVILVANGRKAIIFEIFQKKKEVELVYSKMSFATRKRIFNLGF